MLATEPLTIDPLPLRAREMAQVLAAIFAHEDEVVALVEELAPRTAARMLSELALLASGDLAADATSSALRWILLEIHDQVGRRFDPVLA